VPHEVVLDLPAPLSVNRTRRIDWRAKNRIDAWTKNADAHFLTQKRGLPPPIRGRFEIIITLRDGSQTDADNAVKGVIDVVRRFGLVADDSPKFMRRVTIEFGDVQGCRVTIKAMPDAR
jgi:Holliday junction resolvase RusA-like endonuclease